jgi:methionyl-tRNA formyltransferase
MTTAAFFGTPEPAVPTLDALATIADISLVVTRPPRPRGRGRAPARSPVHVRAAELGLPVATPSNRAELGEVPLDDLDVAVVVAYGALIPAAALERPRTGFLNVHFSVLPRWRGAAPVERAVLAGDDEVGVSIMVMDEGLDTGPVLATETVAAGNRTAGALTEQLAELGASLLTTVLPLHVDGSALPVPQDDALATHAPKLAPEEGHLDPSEGADALVRRVRAMTPRPGAYLESDHGRVVVLDAAPVDAGGVGTGSLAVVDGELVLGTATGAVALRSVRPAGRRTMDGRSWANGVRGDLGRVR